MNSKKLSNLRDLYSLLNVGLICEMSSSKLVNRDNSNILTTLYSLLLEVISLRLYILIPNVALFFNNKIVLIKQLIYLDMSCWD